MEYQALAVLGLISDGLQSKDRAMFSTSSDRKKMVQNKK